MHQSRSSPWVGGRAYGRIASRLPTPPLQGPCGHVVQERRLKRGYQGRQLLYGHARHISHRGGVGGKIAIPSHELCLLS